MGRTPQDFNPHIREGCDAALQTAIMAALNISIHTSVKDVTSSDDRYLHPMQISIHTSVKDVTKRKERATWQQKRFQSTHP